MKPRIVFWFFLVLVLLVTLGIPTAAAPPKLWLLAGNSGTNPNSDFLGTTDNQPLVLKTNGTEAMRVDTGGNVGIGTTSPGARLETRGNAIISNSALTTEDLNDRTLLLGPRPSHPIVVSLGFQVNDSSKAVMDYASGYDDGLGFAVYNGTWFLPATYDLFIKRGGNVGIRTKNPHSTLQVVGNYIQFPTISGGAPPAADCALEADAGRVVVRTDGTTNLYICTGAGGWVGK